MIFVIKKTIFNGPDDKELSLHTAFTNLQQALNFIKKTCTYNVSSSGWEGNFDNIHFEIEEVMLEKE